jgi:hypothetical protein
MISDFCVQIIREAENLNSRLSGHWLVAVSLKSGPFNSFHFQVIISLHAGQML